MSQAAAQRELTARLASERVTATPPAVGEVRASAVTDWPC
jgi:hypothetical protein